jgi:hypothetical protein
MHHPVGGGGDVRVREGGAAQVQHVAQRNGVEWSGGRPARLVGDPVRRVMHGDVVGIGGHLHQPGSQPGGVAAGHSNSTTLIEDEPALRVTTRRGAGAACHRAALWVGWLHLPWASRRATGAAAKAAVRRV